MAGIAAEEALPGGVTEHDDAGGARLVLLAAGRCGRSSAARRTPRSDRPTRSGRSGGWARRRRAPWRSTPTPPTAPRTTGSAACNSTKLRVVVELAVVAVGASQRRTIRSGSGKGSGLNSTASTRLNIAVLAPMPSASTPTATSVNAGERTRPPGVAGVVDGVLDPRTLRSSRCRSFIGSDRRRRRAGPRRGPRPASGRGRRVALGQLEVRGDLVVELAIEAILRGPGRPADGRRRRGVMPWPPASRATSAVACSHCATSTSQLPGARPG